MLRQHALQARIDRRDEIEDGGGYLPHPEGVVIDAFEFLRRQGYAVDMNVMRVFAMFIVEEFETAGYPLTCLYSDHVQLVVAGEEELL